MAKKIEILTDAGGTNNLLEFISTYFPFIDEPITLTYHGRTYKVLAAQARKFEFEDFFISFDCRKCKKECCNNMYIPLGFEQFWPPEKLKMFRSLKPRRYTVWFNERKMKFIIGITAPRCEWYKNRSCLVWDSNLPTQKRPVGCIFFPMTWYWGDGGTVVYTKYCEPFLCTSESTRYAQEDFNRDLNTFEKIAKEVEVAGFPVNYAPIDALKEQAYFSL
ncbi:MAG: hypothetical protein EU536_02695 [Promethearchaeota archaeon]|nr:MAG: hypothetical protein EU536_02695 [Candidatus Lokiarchaeota archaeon]